MKRVWPSLKTNNSQKSITSARTNTPSPAPFTRVALPACFPGCNLHSSTWDWSGMPFSTSPTSWRSRKTRRSSSAFPPMAAAKNRGSAPPRLPQKSRGATARRKAPRQVPLRRCRRSGARRGSLKMGPGVGGDAVAAARALAHRKGASRRVSNRQPQPVRRFPRPSSQPRLSSQRRRIPGPQFRSPCPGSRFPSTAPAPKASVQPVEDRSTPPRANVVLTKPSTLIETPLQWNGDGLLPGESISRYRGEPRREAGRCRSGSD